MHKLSQMLPLLGLAGLALTGDAGPRYEDARCRFIVLAGALGPLSVADIDARLNLLDAKTLSPARLNEAIGYLTEGSSVDSVFAWLGGEPILREDQRRGLDDIQADLDRALAFAEALDESPPCRGYTRPRNGKTVQLSAGYGPKPRRERAESGPKLSKRLSRLKRW